MPRTASAPGAFFFGPGLAAAPRGIVCAAGAAGAAGAAPCGSGGFDVATAAAFAAPPLGDAALAAAPGGAGAVRRWRPPMRLSMLSNRFFVCASRPSGDAPPRPRSDAT